MTKSLSEDSFSAAKSWPREKFFSDFACSTDFFFLLWKFFGLPAESNSISNSSSMIVEFIVSFTAILLDALLSSVAISFLELHSVFVESVCSENSCRDCFVLHEEQSISKTVIRYNSFFIGQCN